MDSKSKEFKELQKKWYAKLEKKGFKDIERPDGRLAAWASRSKVYDRDPDLRGAKEEYYRRAGHFLHDYQFPSATERFIWTKHAEGISIRNIVVLLAKKGTKTNKRTVDETIRRLRGVMFSGKYQERESE